MPLSGEALIEAAKAVLKKEAPTLNVKAVSAGKTEKEVSVETETAATGHKFKKIAHGLETKDVVVLVELNGKKLTSTANVGESVGGLVLGMVYYVHKVEANEFAIAYTKTASESVTEGEWVEYTAKIETTTKFAKVIEAKVKERLELAEATWSVVEKNITGEFLTARKLEATTEAKQKFKWVLCYSQVAAGGTLMLCELGTERELEIGDFYEVTKIQVPMTGFVI